MTTSVGDVVAQLLAVRSQLAAAAVTASRAQADADHARRRYEEAGRGGNHPRIRQAITGARTASEKSAKIARLLSEVEQHIANYINVIAPGAAPTGALPMEVMPDGDRLVSEAERRAGKGEAFLRREIKKADDGEDALKQGEETVTAGAKGLIKLFRNDPGPSQTTAATTFPTAVPANEHPQLDHPITGVVMAFGAGIVGARGLVNMIKRRREADSED